MKRAVVVALGLVWAVTSCGPEDGARPTPEEALAEVGRVEFEESAEDPIEGIDYVGTRPGGGYIIADRQAGRVRLFDEAGRQVRVVGRPGEGPGELEEPSGAVEFPDGRVVVVQRASPRLTIFPPDSAPILKRVPGQYGFWAQRAGEGFVAGVATRETRFARFDAEGTPLATFGTRDPSIAATPFWIFFASEHAAVVRDLVAVSTSFFPQIRLFSLAGDSVGLLGEAPRDWIPVSAPPVSDLSAPGNRERIAEWSGSFSVVRQIAAVADTLLVVEYGVHDPQEADPYFVRSTTVDVYSLAGEKLASDVRLPGPVVGGGGRLLVLVGEPPSPWAIAALEWRGSRD